MNWISLWILAIPILGFYAAQSGLIQNLMSQCGPLTLAEMAREILLLISELDLMMGCY